MLVDIKKIKFTLFCVISNVFVKGDLVFRKKGACDSQEFLKISQA